MAVTFARYQERESGETGWALVGNGLHRLDANGLDAPGFLQKFAQLRTASNSELASYIIDAIDPGQVKILSPLSPPCRILCQGSNYPGSRLETAMDPHDRSFNTLFHKSDLALCAPDADIVCPAHVQLLDYEVELGLVIGASTRGPAEISEANLHEYVAGIVLAQDVTARDIQIPQGQFFKGKSYRTFCPLGPWLCLPGPGEFACLSALELTLEVNGELRQSDCAANMIFKPHETLAELSAVSNLDPGDLVLTGSPGGCALRLPPKPVVKLMGLLPESLKWRLFIKKQSGSGRYLRRGDAIQARIRSADGLLDLGVQNNRVV